MKKKKTDIASDLSNVLNQLKFNDGLMFDGLELDDDTRQSLINSLNSSMENAKILAKAKYSSKNKED